MWKVYSDIVGRMLASLYSAIYGTEALIGVAIWVAGVYSPQFSSWVEEKTGLDDRWLWAPLALLALHLFFKAIYERNKAWEQQIIKSVTEAAEANSSIAKERLIARLADLERLRTLLTEMADAANYCYEPYSPSKAKQWAERVKMTLAGNLIPERASAWPSLAEMPESGQLLTRQTFLRSLIVSLRVDDLRR